MMTLPVLSNPYLSNCYVCGKRKNNIGLNIV